MTVTPVSTWRFTAMLGFLLVLLGLIAGALSFFVPNAQHRLLAVGLILVALGVLVGPDSLDSLNASH